MSTDSGDRESYVFSTTLDTAERWTAYSIVDYLLTYHAPESGFSDTPVPFVLDPDYSQQLLSLDWWKIMLQVQDRTVKEILDAIMDRRRLMSYRCVVVDDEVLVQPFTLADEEIELEDDAIIQPNQNQQPWNFDDDARVRSATVVIDSQPVYDVVRVQGERIGVVWTMHYSANDGTLDKDWTGSLQTAYNAGSTAAGSESDYYIKTQLHRNYRSSDKFASVYRNFRVPTNWNGKTTAGEHVSYDPDNVEEVLGSVADAAPFWHAGLRVEPYTPLRVGVNYTTVSLEPTEDVLSGTLPEYRRPFAIHYKTSTERAYYLDRAESAKYYGATAENGERQWSLMVRPQEDMFGVVLDVQGAMQHVIAEDEFSSADAADATDQPAEVDWKDFYVTVYTLLDAFAEAKYPETPIITGDVERRTTIDIPGKFLDWVVPDTVVDVDASGDLVESDGGWIRDDRNELKSAAKLMHRWYSRERRALDVTRHTLDNTLEIGYLITYIGDGNTTLEVNSVVTQMMLNTREQTTMIRTQFAELDVRGLL